MSLQVWLPLTEDLKQQGLSGSSISGTNVAINSNGKLGNCYSFNGSNSYLLSNSSPFSNATDDWSYACWFKPNNQHQGCLFSDRVEVDITGMAIFYYGSQLLFDDGNRWQFTPSKAITVGAWNHLVFIRQKGVGKKLYLNGELINSINITNNQTKVSSSNYMIGASQYTSNSASGNYLNGCLNDIRIYDHALSPLEVKHLAQGLVLHYPLNRGGFGGDNIIARTSPNEIQYTYPSSDYSDKFSPITTIVPTASQYTLSFWAKSTVNGDKVTSHYYSPNTTTTCVSNQGISRTASDGNMIFTLSTDWEYYWVTYTQTETTAVKHVIFPRIAAVNNQYNLPCVGSGTISVKCVKLEEGSIPTPWIPNQADALYSQMGLDNNIEYDVSGYGNNGTRNGTFSWSGDTPRYGTSAVFSGNQYIVEPNEIITTDSTIALWVKSSLNGNVHVLDARNNSEIGKQPIYQYTNGSIQTGGNAGYVTSNSGLLVANTWVHVVLVQNGNSLLIYKNGDLFQTISCTNSPVIKPTLGARLNFTNKYIGQISDFRIYTTALSADDVMALYKNAGYVDSDGNVYAYEITE